jgi:hypothetical protein
MKATIILFALALGLFALACGGPVTDAELAEIESYAKPAPQVCEAPPVGSCGDGCCDDEIRYGPDGEYLGRNENCSSCEADCGKCKSGGGGGGGGRGGR